MTLSSDEFYGGMIDEWLKTMFNFIALQGKTEENGSVTIDFFIGVSWKFLQAENVALPLRGNYISNVYHKFS